VATPRLRKCLATGSYVPTGDPQWCAGFDLAAIAVPTPFRDGTPDLTSAGALKRSHVRPGATVVLECTR
jgi:UDP-N-acetyl-D-glucosamine dehydrogenase